MQKFNNKENEEKKLNIDGAYADEKVERNANGAVDENTASDAMGENKPVDTEEDRWSAIYDDAWMDEWRTSSFATKEIEKAAEEDNTEQQEWTLSMATPDGTKQRKKKKRKKKHYLLKFIAALLLATGCYLILTSSIFDIKSIAVNDCRYYTNEQIIEKSKISTGMNMFKVSTRKASKRLLKEIYIKEVTVKRKPPSIIEISVLERYEFAALLYKGKYAIIDPDGMVLSISKVVPEVPVIEGVKVKKAKVGEALIAEGNPLYSSIIRVLKATEKNQIAVKKVKPDGPSVKVYVYDSLCFVGTPKNLVKKMHSIDQVLKNMASQNIIRGTLKVSGNNEFPYSPVLDEEEEETRADNTENKDGVQEAKDAIMQPQPQQPSKTTKTENTQNPVNEGGQVPASINGEKEPKGN